MATAVANCGRAEVTTAATTSLLWIASLLTFSFAQTAASCTTSHGITFAVAAVSLSTGAIAAGFMADRLGRSATARLLFVLGALSCIASAATHPDDGNLVLVFAAAAAASAGGSHVSAELMLESVPEKYRAMVLLSYPALFFPVGAVQYLFEQIGWYRSAGLTGFFVILSGMALLRLPESRLFRYGHRDRDVILPPTPRRQAVPPGYSLSDDITQNSALEHSVVGRIASSCDCCSGRTAARSSSLSFSGELSSSTGTGVGVGAMEGQHVKDGPCSRLVLSATALWVLFTAAYYLTSLTFFLPSLPSAPPGSTVGRASLCPAGAAGGQSGAAGTPLAPSAPQCTALPTFHSGAHLMSAEIVAVLITAVVANTKRLGRRLTLALAFAFAAVACAVTAAALPSFGCSGTAERAALEFFVRASLAVAAQGLFLYTLEVCATSVRSTIMGACVALFRMGGLLTLANNLAQGSEARLQWSVYALQHTWALLSGSGGSGMSGATASAVVLGVSANACLLCACLALALPVEPRRQLLRDVPGAPFTDSQVLMASLPDIDAEEGAGIGPRVGGVCSRGVARAVASILRAASMDSGAVMGYGRVSDREDAQGDVRDEEGDAEPAGAMQGPPLTGLLGRFVEQAGTGGGAGARGGYHSVSTDGPLAAGKGTTKAAAAQRPRSGSDSDSDFSFGSDEEDRDVEVEVGVGVAGLGRAGGAGREKGNGRHKERGRDIELEMAVLSGAGKGDGTASVVAATYTADPPLGVYQHRALRRFPRAKANGHAAAQLAVSSAGISSRIRSATGLADCPAAPPDYALLPLSRAIEQAGARQDGVAAAWLVQHLQYLQARCKADKLEDALDAELAGLDTAGLDAAGLAQEVTRFKLLARMWSR